MKSAGGRCHFNDPKRGGSERSKSFCMVVQVSKVGSEKGDRIWGCGCIAVSWFTVAGARGIGRDKARL